MTSTISPLANSGWESLLRSSAALFHDRGYAASTTRDLAAASGLQKASLYHYVERKEDLLYAICTRCLDQLSAAVHHALIQSDPTDTVRVVITTHLLTVLSDRDMYSVTLMETRSLTGARLDEVLEARRAYHNLIHEVVRAGQRDGQIRADIDARFLSMALLDHLNWTLFSNSFELNGPIDKLAEVYARIYLEGAAAAR